MKNWWKFEQTDAFEMDYYLSVPANRHAMNNPCN